MTTGKNSESTEFDRQFAVDFLSNVHDGLRGQFPQPYLEHAEVFEEESAQQMFLFECREVALSLSVANRFIEASAALDKGTGNAIETATSNFLESVDNATELIGRIRNDKTSAIRNMVKKIFSRALNISEVEIESAYDEASSFKEFISYVSQEADERTLRVISKIEEEVSSDTSTKAPSEAILDFEKEFFEPWSTPIYNNSNESVDAALFTLQSIPEWSFWWKLFSDLTHGRSPNFQILDELNLIEDAVWAGGIDAVSEKIDEIRAKFLVDETDLKEELVFDTESELIARKAPPASNPKSLELTLEAVQDDLEDAVHGNYLSDSSYVVKVLRRTIRLHGKNPERVEMDLVKAGRSLRNQVDKGDLPDAPEIEGLHDTCITGALDIRANHKDIAEARANRALQAIREATEEEKAKLAASFDTIRSISTEDLADDLIEDLEEIVDPNAIAPSREPERTTDAVVRSGNRLAKMWIILRTVVIGGTATAGAIVTFSQAIPVLKTLWPLLMGLLGL